VKPGMLCLSLVLACSCTLFEDYPHLGYDLRWTCVSPQGCERAEQVALIDRVFITENNDFCDFRSTRDGSFLIWARLLASDSLPPDCHLLSGFVIFANELDASLLCYTDEDFEVELTVPNSDSATHSKWRVEGRYTGRLMEKPR
jgi:hypothetical protein